MTTSTCAAIDTRTETRCERPVASLCGTWCALHAAKAASLDRHRAFVRHEGGIQAHHRGWDDALAGRPCVEDPELAYGLAYSDARAVLAQDDVARTATSSAR